MSMVVVESSTSSMSVEEAERITQRIALRVDVIVSNIVNVMPFIREALDRKAYAALGYPSAGAYVQDRFGNALSRLDTEVRREFARELATAGLSTRALAPVFGVTQQTIAKDTRRQVTTAASPDQSPVAPVTGLDGRTYPRPPAAQQPRRRPITDTARDVGYTLRKAAEALARIEADDRFAQRQDDVDAALLNELAGIGGGLDHLEAVVARCRRLQAARAAERATSA